MISRPKNYLETVFDSLIGVIEQGIDWCSEKDNPKPSKYEWIKPIETFFSSEEETFFDDQSQKWYSNPNRTHLAILAANFIEMGAYKGMGIHKEQRGLHPLTQERHLCDVVYFTKQDDQVQAEQEPTNLSSLVYTYFKNDERQKKQLEMQVKVTEVFTQALKTLRYGEPLQVCWSSEELKPYFRNDANKVHALVFFYQEKTRPTIEIIEENS